jgi:endonuclease/exonuclease/phosphatase (EEP) superfamily protein YafD
MVNFGLAYFLSHHVFEEWRWNLLTFLMPAYLLALVLCTLTLACLKRWYLFLSCLAALLLLQKPFGETFSIGNLINTPSAKGEEIKVLTFNASTFNNNRKDPFIEDDSIFLKDFFNYLQRLPEKPDILCFQEFHHDDKERDRVIDEIVKISGTPYYYILPMWQQEQRGLFGIITFSRYPIVDKGLVFLGDPMTPNKGQFTDLAIGKDTLRIFNIHLHSMNIRLGDTSLHTWKEKLDNVYYKLKVGDEMRRCQVNQVISEIDKSPYPVLVCGDFNSFPYSYSYQVMKKRLKNVFEEAGFGFGYTLNMPPYLVRLDQVFYSEPFQPVYSKVVRKFPSSDHFALMSKVVLPDSSIK